MQEELFAFKFGAMPVSFQRSAAIGSLGIVIILTIAAVWLTNLTALDTLIIGIMGMLLHWLGEMIHQ